VALSVVVRRTEGNLEQHDGCLFAIALSSSRGHSHVFSIVRTHSGCRNLGHPRRRARNYS
jgi:hypothetical protein